MNNVDNTEKELSTEQKKIFKKPNWYLIIFFVCVIIFALIITAQDNEISVVLGDSGSIVPALFKTVGYMGFKWLPVFGGVGVILSVLNEEYKELRKVFFIITAIVLVISTLSFLVF